MVRFRRETLGPYASFAAECGVDPGGMPALGRFEQAMRLAVVLGGTFLLGSSQAANYTPRVYFNHLYVVLDKQTYHALQDSAQVQALAYHELAHKNDGHSEYTGFYIKGRHTYLEFFGDPIPDGDRLGNVGLGLSVEKEGDLKLVEQRLRTIYGDHVKEGATTYPVGPSKVPWYTAAYVDQGRSDDVLSAWIFEVAPGYLAARHPGGSLGRPLSREQYLSWEFLPDRLLDDVVGVALDLSLQESTELADQLSILGWNLKKGSDGSYTATGPDMHLVVRPTASRGGLRVVELRLRRAANKQHSELGNVSLDLDGRAGRISFTEGGR